MTERKTILFADDKKSMREMMEIFISTFFPTYNFKSFENGTSLEKKLEEDIKDVCAIITDNNMPGIDGIEIIKKFSRIKKFKDIPFILIYGGEKFIGEKAINNGAVAYLLKPFDIEDLKSLINKYVS